MNKREYRVVAPNDDKPHRCPRCHAVAQRCRGDRGYGTRTWLRCEYGCYVRWRAGVCASRLSMRVAQLCYRGGRPRTVVHLVLAGPRDRHVGRPK